MKLFPHEQLLGLPVYTQRGEHLGRVLGFVIESETHFIAQYRVKHRSVFSALFQKESLLISRDEVVSVDEEKMVVKDAVIAVKEPANRRAFRPEVAFPEAGGVLRRDT